MADWEFIPTPPNVVERTGPPTLVTKFADGTEVRRQKSAVVMRTFPQAYLFQTRAEVDTKLEFWKTKLLLTTFTILTFDADAANPLTDEATVRFADTPRVEQISGTIYNFECEIVEVA